MALHEEPVSLTDLLLTEVCPGWTKSTVTYQAGAVLMLGMVLAKVAGKFLPLDLAGAGDEKVAAAVAADLVDATAGDKKGPAICRGAVLDLNYLVWPAGITDVQKATAIAELDARTIVVRSAA